MQASESPVPTGRSRRTIFVGALGTTLEWFDFTLFIYLAPVISKLFFPSSDPVISLIATFGVFAVGYLMRPLGGLFFGNYGDRHGRKRALLLSISLMSVPMLVTGILPTESTIGVAAPILLGLLRLTQGFSVGGEFSGSIVLLQESAPPGRRGFVSNLAQTTAGAGFLLSSLTVTILHATLSEAQVSSWGWRIPFFIGFGIGIGTLLAQRRMPETEVFSHALESGDLVESPARTLWRTERRSLVAVFLLMGYLGMAYYIVATFIPTWLNSVIGDDAAASVLAATIGALLYTVITPFAGSLSDRVGRKPPMYAAALLFAAAAYPIFLLMASGGAGTAIAGECLLMLLVILFTGASTPAISELFTTSTRYSGVAIGYGLGIAIFGGTAPLLATALVKVTGVNEAPSAMLILGSVLVLFLLARMPETFRGPSPDQDEGPS
jgi:MHS family proline/betaine transporter-like MFS transporter